MNKILFIGGTHGDEAFGVEVLQDLEKMYDPAKYNYDWIIGNPRALEANVRFTETDLNRSAPGSLDSPFYEEQRAAEIVELSKDYDAVIDIHGTIADCGIVTIIPYPTTENIALVRTIPIARNVIWSAEASKISGPIAQHTRCPALEIECGPKNDVAIKQQLKDLLGKILLTNNANGVNPANTVQQLFYEVYGADRGRQYEDFQPISNSNETFYPFLSYQYDGKSCQKLRLVNPDNIKL